MDYRDEDLLEEMFEKYADECEDALNIALARIKNVKSAIERAGDDSHIDLISPIYYFTTRM